MEMRGERRTGVLERSRAKGKETPRFNGAETEDLIGSVISIVENGLPLCRIAICVHMFYNSHLQETYDDPGKSAWGKAARASSDFVQKRVVEHKKVLVKP